MRVNRNLRVKSVTYLCDIGDIKTTDGRVVKKGKLYRSSALHALNDKALNYLDNVLNIKRIFDLRTPEEVEFKKDKNMDTTDYHNIALLCDADNPVINRKNRFDIFQEIRKEHGNTKKYLSKIYYKMMNSELGINGFKECFKELLSSDIPTVWHCSQGKDRTGMTTFLLLQSLGVDRDTCIDDYLSFNKHCAFKNFWIFVGVTLVKFNPRMANDLVNLLKAKKCYIEAAIKSMTDNFGSIDNYLRTAIGLTDDDFKRLKELYLV